MIKAVTLDFWGTLVSDSLDYMSGNLRAKILYEYVADQGGSLEQAEKAYNDVTNHFIKLYETEHRCLRPFESVNIMLQKMGTKLSLDRFASLVREFESAFYSNMPPVLPYVGDMLEALKKKDMKIGIVSDTGYTPGRVLRDLLRQENLFHYFDSFTFSDETGVAKPHIEAFEDARVLLQANFNEMLHAGDRPDTDVVGANQAGMISCYYNHLKPDRVCEEADHSFNCWLDFIGFIKELN